MITTTLEEIRSYGPCENGWKKLLKHLGKIEADEPFPMSVILDSNSLEDCIWALRTRPELSGILRLYAVDCARQVEFLMTDQSKELVDIAEKYALGQSSYDELEDTADRAAATEKNKTTVWWAAWYCVGKDEGRKAARDVSWYVRQIGNLNDNTKLQAKMLRQLLDTSERPIWPNLQRLSQNLLRKLPNNRNRIRSPEIRIKRITLPN